MVAHKEAMESHYSGISAFDLDHTLFSGNSSYLFGRYLFKRNILSFSDLAFIINCNLRFKLGLLPIKALHEAAFERLFKGKPYEEVRRWASEFIEGNFDKLLYPPAVNALMSAAANGHLPAIFSSSPDFLIEPVAARLGVSVWYATRYSVDKDRRFCDILRLIQGGDKAALLEGLRQQHQVQLKNVFAYSDSHLDLPFLEAAGNAVGVNPDRRLRAACRRNRWVMI